MALPLRDDLPTRRFPWVTLLLIVINVFVFLFIQPSAYQNPPDPGAVEPSQVEGEFEREDDAVEFAYRYGAVSCEVLGGEALADRPEQCEDIPSGSLPADKSVHLALLTSMFLHGSLPHLGGNMLFLWVFGNNVEDRLGRWRYLGLYLVGGVAATLGFAAVNANASVPLIGASGAIAAAMGAYVVLFPRGRILTVIATAAFQVVYVPAYAVLALFFITQFIAQFFNLEDNVAWEAHVAGMVAGVILALVLARLPGVKQRRERQTADIALRSGAEF